MSALGERFRAAREARGLSLSDVAEQIRIRSVYLAAIEDENWPAIGAPVYVRGFLRTYARFLALDTDEVIGAFNAATGGGSSTPESASAPSERRPYEPEAARSRTLSPLIWLASLVAVVLIAFVSYNEFTLHQQPVAATTTPSATATMLVVTSASPAPSDAASAVPSESPSPAPSGSPAADGAQMLALAFTAPSWVRVTVDGNVSMEGTFPAGTARQFHGKTAVLRIGNAGGVSVTVDGKNVGVLGKTGDVVERTFTL
ncbi:MAG: helix-turn-helix domain-containing protein [bacterium]|nr:helix-turn-helix domain-containing protein [bacterium]